MPTQALQLSSRPQKSPAPRSAAPQRAPFFPRCALSGRPSAAHNAGVKPGAEPCPPPLPPPPPPPQPCRAGGAGAGSEPGGRVDPAGVKPGAAPCPPPPPPPPGAHQQHCRAGGACAGSEPGVRVNPVGLRTLIRAACGRLRRAGKLQRALGRGTARHRGCLEHAAVRRGLGRLPRASFN